MSIASKMSSYTYAEIHKEFNKTNKIINSTYHTMG